ncbi:hypothetical protein Syun_013007 [Stephania yunnanensis]|uniref:F-box domain-containing protein n=1 Tax=Stephania yunnanensis TaxID=152371 RepID=A0AAP0K0I7_9MAGN
MFRRFSSIFTRNSTRRLSRTSSVLHLPDDVLHLIVCKLRSLVCHAAFRSVCKTWRLFAQQHYSYLVPPQPPWLIFPAQATASTTYNFYTFDGVGPFFDVEVPKEYTIGRGSGTWLTFWDTKVERVRVWNPLSSIHILLPCIPGTETILKKFHKFVVSTPGPLIKNNMIFGAFYGGEKLAYIKLGQERWTHVEVDFLHQPPVVPSLQTAYKIHDIVFYQGKLHVVDRTGMVFVCEEDAHAPHYNDHHRRCPVKAVKLIDHLHDKIQKINHAAVVTMLYLVQVKGSLMVLLRYKTRANDISSIGWSYFKVDFSKRNLRSTKDLEGNLTGCPEKLTGLGTSMESLEATGKRLSDFVEDSAGLKTMKRADFKEPLYKSFKDGFQRVELQIQKNTDVVCAKEEKYEPSRSHTRKKEKL